MRGQWVRESQTFRCVLQIVGQFEIKCQMLHAIRSHIGGWGYDYIKLYPLLDIALSFFRGVGATLHIICVHRYG